MFSFFLMTQASWWLVKFAQGPCTVLVNGFPCSWTRGEGGWSLNGGSTMFFEERIEHVGNRAQIH
jgi:hypothetical protein